jgi:hypothetical protein
LSFFTKFEDVTFDDFNAIENLTNARMPMQWFFALMAKRMHNTLHFFSLDTNTLFIVLALKVQQLLSLSLELLSAWQ